MSDILDALNQPGMLMIPEDHGDPLQFRIEQDIKLGSGQRILKREAKIVLKKHLLAKDQGLFTHYLGYWHYKNLTSRNLTTVNAVPLPEGKDIELSDGDVIRIVRNSDYMVMLFLEKHLEKMVWKTVPLDPTKESITIYGFQGKGCMDCDLKNPDTVSGHSALASGMAHVELHRSGMSWSIATDLENQEISDTSNDSSNDLKGDSIGHSGGDLQSGSARGAVYVNRAQVSGSRTLMDDDLIDIGGSLFLYHKHSLLYNHADYVRNELTIHIRERAVHNLLRKKVLLKDINLTLRPGKLVLILGGSGAGKTTFINAVTGYEKAKAEIRLGDVDLYRNYHKIKHEIGMVPQQVLLRGEDTVRMTLMNAAEMRMPEDATALARERRVNEILSLFGLESVEKELVEKLSGGQRKRLSIGVEFTADPLLFVLDEPDSGLDGVMARDLMEQLRRIADQHKIVMVITHTPDRVIDLFDQVIVLAKDKDHIGRLAFYGSIAEARSFFERDTMEEIVLEVNPVQEGGEGRADYFIEKYKSMQKNGYTSST
jgi:ABC-type multidrug transport system ATPase subunit